MMSKTSGFSLVPLECVTCGASIAAQGMDVVFYCSACRNGYRFDNESRGLVPVEVTFVSRPDLVADRYKPFWLIPAEVRILSREVKSKGFSGLLAGFFDTGEEASVTGSGSFAIPAFKLEIGRAIELSRRYTSELPGIDQKLGERLVGGCYDVEDAKKIAHYSVIATEVDKPDLLKNIRYEIEFGESRLLGVPFVEQAGSTMDAFFHIVI